MSIFSVFFLKGWERFSSRLFLSVTGPGATASADWEGRAGPWEFTDGARSPAPSPRPPRSELTLLGGRQLRDARVGRAPEPGRGV